MSKQLIIVRHGNTFLPDQTPTRVGARTDLPLVENEKALAVGKWLKQENCIPDYIYAAPLKRTRETAEIIKASLDIPTEIIMNDKFVEIDYGPDENKTEDEVRKRLGTLYFEKTKLSLSEDKLIEKGKEIINDWDINAVVPEGWDVDIHEIIDNWIEFSQQIPENSKVLICSSNGIIRFSPHILGDKYQEFVAQHPLKVATGSISIFSFEDGIWQCKVWNLKP